ncbi:hypothetical protein [Dyadobacter sp. NIV53]|uniref:hypothetical protein n=1 Tax=Dyadobacter sp. NIV53 TaxID=2861765 RepID=UPI001C86B5BA|nr:hypothetical protein [Dyadobacter sp. NIV53]
MFYARFKRQFVRLVGILFALKAYGFFLPYDKLLIFLRAEALWSSKLLTCGSFKPIGQSNI